MSAARKAAQAVKEVASTNSGKTISVGCKLPNGLHLDRVKLGEPIERVTLRGSNAARVVGGYGITTNVPEEFFNDWMKRHSQHPAVRNGLIFAHHETASVRDIAKERAENLTGFEPVNKDKPYKGVKPLKRDDADDLQDEED